MKKKYLALALAGVTLLSACGTKEKETVVKDEDIEIVEDVEKDVEEAVEDSWFKDMKTVDLDGNEIDNTMFQEYDLTLINLWATWCPPCIMEIPELEEVSKSFTNVGIKGLIVEHDKFGQLVSEATEENKEAAGEILKNSDAQYQQILPWEGLLETGYSNVISYPETVFVDSEGNFVGSAIKGAKNREQWTEIINERLEMVKNEK